MKTKLACLACLLACLFVISCEQAPSSNAPANIAANKSANTSAAASSDAKKAAPTDLEKLAERLVTQSAGVKEGEVVLISGYPQDQELMENIAVHVRKVGGFPLIDLASDRLTKRMYDDVPAQYDSQANALGLKLADMVDVTINITGSQTESVLTNPDPARLAARGKANESAAQAFLRNKVRTVEVGNSLYPTSERAGRFQMPEAELSKTFWEGVNIDYTSLQTRGEEVKAVLAAGNELHITNPNGTDLRVRVQGRPVSVSDGIISAEDVRKGDAGGLNVFLPAGEVYVTPVAGSAEGTIVHTRDFFRNKEIKNLRLTISAGKVTGMTGEGDGFADLKALYDATEGRKDELSFVDLGINPNVKIPPASQLGNWVTAGMITVGLGSNTWAGGDNSVPFGYTVFLPGSTVTLDGRTIIENGVLKI